MWYFNTCSLTFMLEWLKMSRYCPIFFIILQKTCSCPLQMKNKFRLVNDLRFPQVKRGASYIFPFTSITHDSLYPIEFPVSSSQLAQFHIVQLNSITQQDDLKTLHLFFEQKPKMSHSQCKSASEISGRKQMHQNAAVLTTFQKHLAWNLCPFQTCLLKLDR